jgi:hypothetical protein
MALNLIVNITLNTIAIVKCADGLWEIASQFPFCAAKGGARRLPLAAGADRDGSAKGASGRAFGLLRAQRRAKACPLGTAIGPSDFSLLMNLMHSCRQTV